MSPKLTEKEIKLFNILHDSQIEDARTFNKPKYAMYWTSIVDKYKEKAHFVYELLQNADDAHASEVEFQLEKDRLVFRHNGKIGFSVSLDDDKKHKGHINAITGIGWTTKDKDTEKIGKFGVGFKSVFQYTKEPGIYDDKFWFKIEDYIVPTWLDSDFPGRKEGETVFVLPFTKPSIAYVDISNRLRTLDNPILFLRHLKKVTITIPGEDTIVYTKDIVDQEKISGITHELLAVNNNNVPQNIHMFTKAVNVSYKGQNSVQNISVGYLLDRKGNIEYRGDFKVFCFFPTEEDFDLRCIVHAPFLLVDSRQSIKDDPVNDYLKDKLAYLASTALVILRDYGIRHNHLLINENIFHMIPEKRIQRWGIYDYEDDPFRDEYIKIISHEKLLLSRESRYMSCEEAVICRPLSLMGIITDEQLNKLYKSSIDNHQRHFLCEQIQRIYSQKYVSDVLDELDVDTFNGTELANRLTPEFMGTYGFVWAKKLYTHLRNEEVGLYKRTKAKSKIGDTPFLLSPIILTKRNEWIAPYLEDGSYNVYLPLVSEASGYNFISSKYDEDNELRSFIGDLNLKTPDEWDYICKVLKFHKDSDTIDEDKYHSDFYIIYDYLAKLSDEDKSSKIREVAKSIYIKCNDGYYRTPANLYDDKDWLKSYFGKEAFFVDYSYYQDFIKRHSIETLRNFFYNLGVKGGPCIEEETHWWVDKRKFNIDNYSTAVVSDYKLAGFENWSDISKESSVALWSWLSDNVDNIIEKSESICKYQYYKWYEKRSSSTLVDELKNKEWLFDANGKLVSASHIHIEDLESNEYLINYKFIKLLGIEKNTKSLEELGASATQILQGKLGRFAAELGLDSEDKLREAVEALKEKNEIKVKNNTSVKTERTPSQHGNEVDESYNTFHGQQRQTSLEEMSASTNSYNTPKIRPPKTTDERIDEINQKLADEANKKIEEESKRADVANIEKYTKKWFDTLLDLEYDGTSENIDYSRNSIKITFTRFRKEKGSKLIYILSNPSRNIPIWIEEVEGISIKFTFSNQDDLSLTFEVANVKDFNLRVKAKSADVEKIDSIVWEKCTKAVIELNSPTQILGRLRTAFQSLDYDDNYNFKNHLSNRISFVFGPPGTGKTTRLAEIIDAKMKSSKCRILVLAPTNKACDVLTKKLLDKENSLSWLGRFVATGDEFIEDSSVVVDRDSTIYTNNKCCIVSTIARLPYDGFTQSEDNKLLKDINWDYVIVDEASMIPIAQIVFALYKLTTPQFIIAGDPLQIQPIVREDAWKGENIFSMIHLDNFVTPKTEPIQFDIEKLNTQYRSIPSIGNLYSFYCYDGKLDNARSENEREILPMGKIPANAVTFIPFKVERYDSIYGAKKLQGSNVHIYSAIFAVESCAYIAKQQTDNVKIGIICPYAPQAQLINKLIGQRYDIPENVEITVGTVHGFQGDQCDIIFAVFNPPTGIRVAADRIMLNNRNVINVAISRASDYLFILLPHPDSYGYENLVELNKLAKIANKHVNSVAVINADHVEKYIFDNPNYIESNTFVTTHQVANVYTKAACLYEVRIDDNAIDIQVGYDSNLKEKNSSETENVTSFNSYKQIKEQHGNDEHQKLDKSDNIDNISDNNNLNVSNEEVQYGVKDAINQSKLYKTPEMYTMLFKKYGIDLPEALDIVINNDTKASLFIAFLIVGSNNYRNELGWRNVEKIDILSKKSAIERMSNGTIIYPWLLDTFNHKKFPIKGINKDIIENISYESFIGAFDLRTKQILEKRRAQSIRNKRAHQNASKTRNVGKTPYYYSRHESQEREEDKLYNKFDFGLSDWD